jgi:hypothetical protein
LDGSGRFREFGFHSNHVCYIHCSATCEEYAKQEFNWSPSSTDVAPVPPAFDVSYAFGSPIDANIDINRPENIVESGLRKRKAVNYRATNATDDSITPAPRPSAKEIIEDPDFTVDETTEDKSEHRKSYEKENARVHQVTSQLLLPDCYDVVFPCSEHGYLILIGSNENKNTVFLGYRKMPDGGTGLAEIANRVRGVGDRIIAVNRMDVSTTRLRKSSTFSDHSALPCCLLL